MTSDSETPCAEAAEAAILAIAFERPDQFIPKLRAQGVTQDTFWKWNRLAGEILRFFDENGALETIAFHQDLIRRGAWDSCGGSHVFDIISAPSHTAYGWTKWVEQIQECHALRLARSFHQSSADYENSSQAQESLEKALESIKKAKTGESRAVIAKEAADAFLEEFIANREAGDIPGKSTGIQELDAVSGGMRPGELWVVCGHTSRGKSVLMLQLTAEVIQSGGRVVIFSLEMMRTEIIARLVSLIGRIDFGKIMQPRLLKSSDELERLKETVRTIAQSIFWIDDQGQTLAHIEAECAHLADEHGGLELVMVDYLQIMEREKAKGETREQEISSFSRGLKRMAKRLGCPVVTGAQLTDEGKVRESRAINMDANAVLVIGEDGVLVGKMRNGKRDVILPLWLNGAFQRFTALKPQPK